MKPVLIGQEPGNSKSGWPAESEPLMGRAGRRLASLASVEYPGEYRHTFTRANIPSYTDTSTKRASQIATRLRLRFEGRVILLLGHAVARAFKCSTLEYLMPTSQQDDGAVLVKFPHPSGLNLWWDNEKKTTDAAFFLSEVVKGRVHYSSHVLKFGRYET